MTIFLSIDLELFEHTEAGRSSNKGVGKNVSVKGLAKLLSVLNKHQKRATFFVVSEIISEGKNEEIKRIFENEILNERYEIGSHSKTHSNLTEKKIKGIKKEVITSKKELEEVTNKRINGFRAPTFRFNRKVLESVREAGYEYDSSVVPCFPIPGWYGSLRFPNKKFKLESKFKGIDIQEKPITVNPITRLPISGAWLRLVGKTHAKLTVKYFEKRNKPIVLYLHPWEFVKLPKKVKPITRFRTGRYVEDFLKWLVKKDYNFDKLRNL